MPITLKAARVNCGLTQREAAEKLEVSYYTLGNWEKAKTFPDAKQIMRIEEVYGVSYDELIFLPANNALSVNEETKQTTN